MEMATPMAGREGKKKKRISIDMVGQPQNFAHLVHASDQTQAEALLKRWHVDGQGKIGHPGWAQPIKEAVRENQLAAGVAETQYARHGHGKDANDGGAGLKVVNGLPSSVPNSLTSSTSSKLTTPYNLSSDTNEALEDARFGADEDELLQLPPSPFVQMERTNSAETILVHKSGENARPAVAAAAAMMTGTIKFSPAAWQRPGAPASLDRPGAISPSEPSSPLSLPPLLSPTDPTSDPCAVPPNFVPSLTTIEKAVATKVYLETKYHALLKMPPSRETRRALLEKELARLNISDRERMRVRQAWMLSETEYLRETRSRVGIGSFAKLRTIGHGAFGVVSLVRERGTGELYAMKQLRKADMLRKGQEGHVRAERDLLASAATSTRWTVRLAYSFQDVDHLYLVMSFMAGGDLLTLLIDKDTFEESFARFYVAEMVLAIQETHQVLGALHRDIKPDNFLFDANGHIAISDFGLATDFHWAHDGKYFESQRRELLYKHGIDLEDRTRPPTDTSRPFDPPQSKGDDEAPASLLGWRDQNRRRMAFSVVGVSSIQVDGGRVARVMRAVEVLRGTGYSQSCDWWSLGVIMFEMLYGYPPFVSKSRQQTRQKILNWRQSLRFPPKPRVSREAQDLILSLLCEKEDRLGSRSTGRPNSVLQDRRSGFVNVNAGAGAFAGVANDGAEEIKAHPWFKGIDWGTLHLQTPPFRPQLSSETDTRYFEDDIDDNPLPAPEIAPGVPAPDTTLDPMLRHAVQGAHLLEVRKELAFHGWTYRKPKRQVYDPRHGLDLSGDVFGSAGRKGTYRGRSTLRVDGPGSSFIRSLSV
ncbi:SPOSA6832_04317 [Sporobolomyces salmonicolor]|uniref:non-specific serine/threonine protein kinase n=1 Tax=Sporidiobolus salmonicolor TaxID=5005 RepID=A0A0D6ERB7_SPOSA|nr:SPOSA6832_04317 [Sporobolomyces salmonicolor]